MYIYIYYIYIYTYGMTMNWRQTSPVSSSTGAFVGTIAASNALVGSVGRVALEPALVAHLDKSLETTTFYTCRKTLPLSTLESTRLYACSSLSLTHSLTHSHSHSHSLSLSLSLSLHGALHDFSLHAYTYIHIHIHTIIYIECIHLRSFKKVIS